jgi:hypothetical protein
LPKRIGDHDLLVSDLFAQEVEYVLARIGIYRKYSAIIVNSNDTGILELTIVVYLPEAVVIDAGAGNIVLKRIVISRAAFAGHEAHFFKEQAIYAALHIKAFVIDFVCGTPLQEV